MTALALLISHLACAQTPGPVAGSVVRSKEWIVRRGASPEEEFKGDVRYSTAKTTLTGDWALYRHKSKDWTARGHVNLRQTLDDGGLIEARGETAYYDETGQTGRLEPKSPALVTVVHTPADGSPPDQGEGQRFDWISDLSGALVGRAHAWGPRLELWADRAQWERSTRRLELRGGRPVLRKVDEDGGWITALKADEAEATESPRRIEARGRVVGWILFTDKIKLKEPAR